MGKNQLRLLRFAIKYPVHWHSYGKEQPTIRALRALERKGFIEIDAGLRMFRLETTSTEIQTLRANFNKTT